ncbi:signal recognition particle-docking protein FtsY [Williamsia sp. SKLECPSW1]
MSTELIVVIVVAVVAVLLIALVAGLVIGRRRRVSLREADTDPTPREVDRSGSYTAGGGFSFTHGGGDTATVEPPVLPERTDTDGQPGVGDDAAVPRDSPRRSFTDLSLPETDVPPAGPTDPEIARPLPETPPVVERPSALDETVAVPDDAATIDEQIPRHDVIEPVEGRLTRLRGRLARSQSTFGKGMLGLLGGGDLDEESWEEVEDLLLSADLGAATTTAIVDRLRTGLAESSVRTSAGAREVLRTVLIDELLPEMDRSIRALPHAGNPAVLLVVGVNGTGKTTTVGKLARVLVADGRRVLLGAADTFRAAAADQLQTWGERVGATTVRGKEGADPASVAFEAVADGVADGVDVVVVDTAGRLHTKTGLMDELGKVKRVVEKKTVVDEVLLVLDATTGQNGLTQAKVFGEVVDITGVVLTKLDGTAKGGIVFRVQRELGVPVKLVGLGEGADDLAPFEPAAFVDALLG